MEEKKLYSFAENYNDDKRFVSEFIKGNYGGGNYLPWAKAWLRFKEKYPNGDFRVVEFENELPLSNNECNEAISLILSNENMDVQKKSELIRGVLQDAHYKTKSIYQYDPLLGYRIAVELTLDGETFQPPISLAVMESNLSMKSEPYTYVTVKNKEMHIHAASYTDIHNSIMRCVVKAIAIHTGIGLSLWVDDENMTATETISEVDAMELKNKVESMGLSEKSLLKHLESEKKGFVANFSSLNKNQYNYLIEYLGNVQTNIERKKYIKDSMKNLKLSEKQVLKMLADRIEEANKTRTEKISVPISIDTMTSSLLYDTCKILLVEQKKIKPATTKVTKAKETSKPEPQKEPPSFLNE